MDEIRELFRQLDDLRSELGMSCAALAKRAGLGLRTVQRILAGEESDGRVKSIVALARALGARIEIEPSGEIRLDADPTALRQEQAEAKARRLVSMVQGTSALEAQAVSSEVVVSMNASTTAQLLAGPDRRLWDE